MNCTLLYYFNELVRCSFAWGSAAEKRTGKQPSANADLAACNDLDIPGAFKKPIVHRLDGRSILQILTSPQKS